MHKHDNESVFGLRVFIRYADTHTHTHTRARARAKTAAEEGDGLRKSNGKIGIAHSWTGASFHSCAVGEISEVETAGIYSFSPVASTFCF